MTTTVTRGPYRTGIKRKREILAAAAGVFGQYGYAGGSLRQIAGQVGVSPAALIKHFGSKEGLLIALLEYWNEEVGKADWTGEGPAVHQGLDYFDAMRSVMRYHVSHRGLLELFLTMTVEATDPNHPAREFITERYRSVVADATANLAEASKRGEVRPLSDDEIEAEVRHLFAVMDGLEIQWLLNPDIDLIANFEQAYSQIRAGWQRDRPASAHSK